ncbi:hypothetical protein ACOALZ_18455 [Nocardiopsis algeriensis]|uniref:hypothetical protein n=1 Tax=Nocardiopsis algeriensis TaxID=1478215 RepID=UPI003B43973C
MSEEPYDVDTDMGDDPEISMAKEFERHVEPDFGIEGRDFADDSDQGGRGIDQAVRDERSDVYPRENWGGEDRGAEEEAVHVVDDTPVPEDSQGAAVRDPHPERPWEHPADTPHGDREDERDRTKNLDSYVPDAADPKDSGAPGT